MKMKPKIQEIVLDIYFVLLLISLLVKLEDIRELSDALIYGSTLILILHIWWGAFIALRYIQAKKGFFIRLLEIFMLSVLLPVPFFIRSKETWALLLCVFFILVIWWYLLLYGLANKKIIKKYIRKKIKYKMVAPILFLLLYVLLGVFKSEFGYLILSFLTFLGQIVFALFLFKIKKVYEVIQN